MPLNSLIVVYGLVKVVIFWRNYKIESQNKKTHLFKQIYEDIKSDFVLWPNWLELSREGDKRLHNQVFFSPPHRSIQYTLHHHSHPPPWYLKDYFFVSNTNYLFIHAPLINSSSEAEAACQIFGCFAAVTDGRRGNRELEVAYPHLPTLHLFPATYVFLRHTTWSFISQQRRCSQSWPNTQIFF